MSVIAYIAPTQKLCSVEYRFFLTVRLVDFNHDMSRV